MRHSPRGAAVENHNPETPLSRLGGALHRGLAALDHNRQLAGQSSGKVAFAKLVAQYQVNAIW